MGLWPLFALLFHKNLDTPYTVRETDTMYQRFFNVLGIILDGADDALLTQLLVAFRQAREDPVYGKVLDLDMELYLAGLVRGRQEKILNLDMDINGPNNNWPWPEHG